ncbi:MAG: NOL1/NOP2/sun family putative RNA methylase [Candidatus Woesearchaeota archaeon]|jgi:ribosomal RNA methyltransferase Nop2
MNFITRYEELGQKFLAREVQTKKSIRVNTLKISEFELIKRLRKNGVKLEKAPFLDHGYFYEADFSLGSTPDYLQGYYYLQEAASQIPVQEMELTETDVVLDMAASPGSKTTQMAQIMNNKGVIIALDNDRNRLDSLQNNLERLSITNTIILRKDSRFADDFKLKFDKILLDAPCSGNFCIESDYFSKRSLNDLFQKSKTQKELLVTAIKCLKSGGLLIYSTCSLEPEEDEMVIDAILQKHPEVKLVELKTKIGDEGCIEAFGKVMHPSLKLTRKFWPHKTNTEGFFIAKFRKE